MTDKKAKLDVQRFLEELGVIDTDYVFVYDADGNPKEIYIPYYLDDDDLMPESVSATLELFYAYIKKNDYTAH